MSITGLANSRLVSYFTSDGLKMKGYLATAEQGLATIIHIHGSCGNFYENEFLPYMAKNYTANGINFLTVNNRGHDCMAEAYRNGNLVYIGGYHEIIEECVLDISGVVEFAKQIGSKKIILQGHSLGCLKVLIYLTQAEEIYDFILLSPSDSYQLQSDYVFPETLDNQVARIKESFKDNMDVLLPDKEFGIKEKDLCYYIPTTPRNFLSLFDSPKTRLLAYRMAPDYFINSNAIVYYGGSDRLQTETLDTVKTFFKNQTRESSILYREGGDHHFHGYEEDVTLQLASWAYQRAISS